MRKRAAASSEHACNMYTIQQFTASLQDKPCQRAHHTIRVTYSNVRNK